MGRARHGLAIHVREIIDPFCATGNNALIVIGATLPQSPGERLDCISPCLCLGAHVTITLALSISTMM